MSTTLIVILAVVAVLIGFITFTHFKVKNAKPVENSKKIIVLGTKNFKLALKKNLFHMFENYSIKKSWRKVKF